MTKPYLLDINVLLALAWPSHVHHTQAQRWFAQKGAAGFRTCPLTQIGFIRICINPRFTPGAVSPKEALLLLEHIIALPNHEFWPDDLPLSQAVKDHPIVGHRQVTDAYLLALATARGGVLASFDRALLCLPGSLSGDVELVQDFGGVQ